MKKIIFLLATLSVNLLLAQDTVKQLLDFGGPACEGAISFVVGGKAYAGMGQIGPNQYTKSIFRYNPNKDTWDVIASFPEEGRAYPIVFVADDKAYVGFGERVDAITGKVTRTYSDLYEFDSASETWSSFDKGSQAAMTGVGQASVFTTKENGKLVAHITGGRNSKGAQGVWYSYSPSENKWTYPIANQVEIKRYGAAAATVNNKGYIIGGKDDSKILDNMLQYDPNASSLKLTTFLSGQVLLARHNAIAASNGSNIFLMYGSKENSIQFNVSSKQIANLGDILKIQNPRKGMVAFIYLNRIFLGMGRGSDENLNSDLYTIDKLTVPTKETAAAQNNLALSPNPANNNLTISNLGNIKNNIRIFNLQGKLLWQQECWDNRCEINTSLWADGIYLLKSEDAKEAKFFVVKH